MIHGPDVFSKYNVIVNGRLKEVKQQRPLLTVEEITESMWYFITEVRNSDREAFDTWYELYK